MCQKRKETKTLNFIGQGAQGWRQHKGRLGVWVLVSVFAQEDFGELLLLNCFWSRQIQDSISYTAEKGHKMFLPKLTNEMRIKCRDRMASAARYERTHRWHGTSIGPNWPQVTLSDIRDGAWLTTSQPYVWKKGSNGDRRACDPVRL